MSKMDGLTPDVEREEYVLDEGDRQESQEQGVATGQTHEEVDDGVGHPNAGKVDTETPRPSETKLSPGMGSGSLRGSRRSLVSGSRESLVGEGLSEGARLQLELRRLEMEERERVRDREAETELKKLQIQLDADARKEE